MILNFTSDDYVYNIDAQGFEKVIGNYKTALAYGSGQITLKPWEAVLLKKV